MFTPYDWQEGIGSRASYIEGKLALGAPVIAVSLDAGILVTTRRRQTRKIYEIYDRLLFAAIGQQSDVESLRNSALEFAHREGYNRSEQDVTIQRVITALSAPIKRAFGDFGSAPFVARTLFAEVGETPEADAYYVLDFDGDYSVSRLQAVIAGTDSRERAVREALEGIKPDVSVDEGRVLLAKAYLAGTEDEGTDVLHEEAVLLERASLRENRFRLLTPEDY